MLEVGLAPDFKDSPIPRVRTRFSAVVIAVARNLIVVNRGEINREPTSPNSLHYRAGFHPDMNPVMDLDHRAGGNHKGPIGRQRKVTCDFMEIGAVPHRIGNQRPGMFAPYVSDLGKNPEVHL